MKVDVDDLCYADMLTHGDGWYIVRRIWRKPVWPELQPGQERTGEPLAYRLEGFDLIESITGTLRQATAAEVQKELDEGSLTFHHPPTVRRVKELR